MTDFSLDSFMAGVVRRNPGETEFHQAVREVAVDIIPFEAENPLFREARVFERLAEPDRVVSFRVVWETDRRRLHINRGYRVQWNNAIGPYKGGLRFHPSVNQSILKFLAFEQTFKNSLTGLPIGGAKGGSDFDPKGRSDAEIMRFCQAFMTELHRHIGPNTDVPAGDIGVGDREIGYLFGQYKRLQNAFEAVLTGKALEFGGSYMRPEATGYGVVYMMEEMLALKNEELNGRTCVVSGSGNVALHCCQRLIHMGAKVVTLSDSSGFVHDPAGIDTDKFAWVYDLKLSRRGRIEEYAKEVGCDFHAGERPWAVPCDLAFPCATQNELDEPDARSLVEGGCRAVAEGANMPSTPAAMKFLAEARVPHMPGKAANAGGVAVSGLEMSQNSQRFSWSRGEVNTKLHDIIRHIHEQCVRHGEESGFINYCRGANIGGYTKVAEAMLAYGVV